MISEHTMLAKLKNYDVSGANKSYWTYMNINGFVEEMPVRLAQLLNEEGWTDLQTKQIASKDFA